MTIKVTCLHQNEELRLIRDFCKWQGFRCEEHLGQHNVPRVEYTFVCGQSLFKGHPVSDTHECSGFIAFVDSLIKLRLLNIGAPDWMQ